MFKPCEIASEKLLGADDVCRRLKISKRTLFRWTKNGIFPPGRRTGGRKTVWTCKEFWDWFNSLPRTTEDISAQEEKNQ